MQAGWDCGFEPNEARLFEMRRSADWLQFMLDLPMVAQPGTRFAYCSGNPHVLSTVLSQVTATTPWSLRDGSCSSRWEFKTFTGRPIRTAIPTVGRPSATPSRYGQLGQLFLQRGRFGTNQLLAESWVTNATTPTWSTP
jgi:CubicO group peptidase (beta-lactamase class C family)